MKIIHKSAVKENIQENQKGIFLVNTASKIEMHLIEMHYLGYSPGTIRSL